MTVLSVETLPGYQTGTWTIDPVHTNIAFTIRHMMVSKVRGSFEGFSGTITTTDDPAESSVKVSIDVASVSTGVADRDGHLKSNDFFDVEQFPTIEFASTGVRVADGDIVLDGELTLHGVTKPVSLDVEFGGVAKSLYGQTVLGAEATTTLKRSEFGLEYNAALETGGVLLGDDIKVNIEVEASLNEA